MSPRLLLPFLFFTATAFAADDNANDNPVNQTPVALDPFVVITGQLDKAREDIVPSLGATVYQIDKIQIDTQVIGANANFSGVLLHAPGVAQDSFGQVHLRGEHANLQYRINDVLLPEGISGFSQELDTRFVQTASVLTGSLPAQYGYRTAGVVDIHTRSGTPARAGDVALYGGSFDTLRASAEVTGSQDKLHAYVTVSDSTSGSGIENPTASRDPLHDRTDQFKAFGYFSDVIDSTSRLNLMISGSSSRFQIPNNPGQEAAFTLAGVTSFDSANLDENQREENDYAILAYQQTVDNFSAQLSAFARYSLVQFTPDRAGDLIFNGVASAVHRDLTGGGFEANLKWSAAATHTVRGGLLLTGTHAGTRTTTTVFPVDANGDQTSATPFDIPDNQHKLGWLYGAYLQDEWKPAAGFTINYGARADLSRAYVTEGQLSPRVNLVYQLTDTTSMHAGYARYFTPPPLELVQTSSLNKFNGTTNAPEIAASSPVRSERAHYFDAGLSHQFTSAFTATLDGYAKRATNQLDEGQFGQALIFSPFNYRRGRVYGVELTTNYTQDGFSAYANLALSRATGRAIVSGEFQFGPDELAYIAAHDVSLDHDQTVSASTGGSYRLGGTVIYADLLYGSGLRRGFANTEHLPAYHPFNLGVEHTFKLAGTRELHLRLDVVNVFDEIYELRDGSGIGVGAPQFGQRRGLYGGLTLAF
jgi:outer membrane receptor protein involved in Fe transport